MEQKEREAIKAEKLKQIELEKKQKEAEKAEREKEKEVA